MEGVPERPGALLRASSVHAQALGTPRGASGSAGLGSASAPARAPRSRLSSGSGWASEPRAGGAPRSLTELGSAGLGSDFERRASGGAERPSQTGAAQPAALTCSPIMRQVSGQAVQGLRGQHSPAVQHSRHFSGSVTCASNALATCMLIPALFKNMQGELTSVLCGSAGQWLAAARLRALAGAGAARDAGADRRQPRPRAAPIRLARA